VALYRIDALDTHRRTSGRVRLSVQMEFDYDVTQRVADKHVAALAV